MISMVFITQQDDKEYVSYDNEYPGLLNVNIL